MALSGLREDFSTGEVQLSQGLTREWWKDGAWAGPVRHRRWCKCTRESKRRQSWSTSRFTVEPSHMKLHLCHWLSSALKTDIQRRLEAPALSHQEATAEVVWTSESDVFLDLISICCHPKQTLYEQNSFNEVIFYKAHNINPVLLNNPAPCSTCGKTYVKSLSNDEILK